MFKYVLIKNNFKPLRMKYKHVFEWLEPREKIEKLLYVLQIITDNYCF